MYCLLNFSNSEAKNSNYLNFSECNLNFLILDLSKRGFFKGTYFKLKAFLREKKVTCYRTY